MISKWKQVASLVIGLVRYGSGIGVLPSMLVGIASIAAMEIVPRIFKNLGARSE